MVAARPTPGGGLDHAVLDGKPLLILVLAPNSRDWRLEIRN